VGSAHSVAVGGGDWGRLGAGWRPCHWPMGGVRAVRASPAAAAAARSRAWLALPSQPSPEVWDGQQVLLLDGMAGSLHAHMAWLCGWLWFCGWYGCTWRRVGPGTGRAGREEERLNRHGTTMPTPANTQATSAQQAQHP